MRMAVRAPAIARLKQRFGIGEELIQRFSQPYLYLNYDVRRASGLDRSGVEPAVAEELRKFVDEKRTGFQFNRFTCAGHGIGALAIDHQVGAEALHGHRCRQTPVEIVQ